MSLLNSVLTEMSTDCLHSEEVHAKTFAVPTLRLRLCWTTTLGLDARFMMVNDLACCTSKKVGKLSLANTLQDKF